MAQLGTAQLDPPSHRRPFAGWPMAVFGAMMTVFALYASTHMVAAGDTWVALACGRHFVNHGVDTVEPFSFNSHEPGPTAEQVAQWPGWARKIVDLVGLETVKKWHPTGWINQNWLTHVLFYRLVTGFGSPDEPHYNALVYWKFAIYLLTVAAIYALGRTLGVSVPGAAAAATLAMVVGRTFLDIRPAGFSNLLVPAYLLVLALAVRRHVRWIWLIVPITVLWANVHGGYLYVFVMLVPFVVLHALGLVLPAERVVRLNRWQDLAQIVGAGAVAFVAMVLFNPFHFTNLTHTFEISVSKHAESWRSVNEWHPAFEWSNPVGESFPFLVFFVLVIVAVIGWLGARLFRPLPLDAPIRRVKARDAWFAVGLPVYGTIVIIAGGVAVCLWFSVIDTSAANIVLAAVFLLILVMAAFWSVHFIYFAALLVLITLAMTNPNSQPGYAGRYIWPFVMVPAYVAIRAMAPLFPRRSPYRPTDLAIVAATAVVTLLAMLIMFDPFKAGGFGKALAGLAHLQRPWQPRFEFQGGRTEPFHYPHYFTVIYALNLLAAVGYLAWPYLRMWGIERTARVDATASGAGTNAPATNELAERPFSWPPIDLAMLAIAALTLYMALKSRRFIPIAAAAAAPIVALFVEQTLAMIVARIRFATQRRLAVPVLTEPLRRSLIGVAAAITLLTAAIWGAKYKRIYLDPWPADDIRDSVFMRMTASNVKPFDVCTFIRENHLSGRVYNYWTEGGAIAWGQTPDPETGKTPLQVFMDGRAQAAYNHDKFELWRHIKGGGDPVARLANQPGKVVANRYLNLTLDDYRQIGEWIDQTLKKMQVWVVLMPSTEVPYPQVSVREINPESKYYFVKALQVIGNWATAYMDDNQHLLVDIETPQGKALMDKVLNDKAAFPNEYSRHLTLANALLRYSNRELARKGFEHAKQAFELRKTQAAAMKLAYEAPRHAELVQPAAEVLRAYVDDFLDHHDQYACQSGYAQRLLAALIGARRLAGVYAKADPERARRYRQFEQQYRTRPRQLALEAKW